MALFESYERRIEKINSVLSQYGISSVEECREICKACLLYTSVRRFQRKYGAGTHYLRTAFRADIAQSSHIVSHRGPPCMIDQIWISCAWGR